MGSFAGQGLVLNEESAGLLTAGHIRDLAFALGIRPTKTLGQNFVHDAGTVRRIVRDADVRPGDAVLEVGPGLGSLTLALLEAGATVSAIEIDGRLASALLPTVQARIPEASGRVAVAAMDATSVTGPGDLAVPTDVEGPFAASRLVANLPYNAAVPILLTLLEALPSVVSGTVMVQAEVADRLAAAPGSRAYGIPSVKLAWYADARRGAKIGRSVFWPVPNVDSALVSFVRHGPPTDIPRQEVFAVVDAAFAQRRKTLRSALSRWAGSPGRAEELLRAAGVDPSARGETLRIQDFVEIATAAR